MRWGKAANRSVEGEAVTAWVTSGEKSVAGMWADGGCVEGRWSGWASREGAFGQKEEEEGACGCGWGWGGKCGRSRAGPALREMPGTVPAAVLKGPGGAAGWRGRARGRVAGGHVQGGGGGGEQWSWGASHTGQC